MLYHVFTGADGWVEAVRATEGPTGTLTGIAVTADQAGAVMELPWMFYAGASGPLACPQGDARAALEILHGTLPGQVAETLAFFKVLRVRVTTDLPGGVATRTARPEH